MNTHSLVAKKLNIKEKELQKESIKTYLEKELLNLKTELFSIAIKYDLKDIKSFEKAVKKGEISENSQTREDFFRWDYLEKKIEDLQKLLNIL